VEAAVAEFDVLVVGDANPDLLLRGDVRPRFGQAEQLLTGADLVLGGSAAITAAGCARLGLRTALFAAVGYRRSTRRNRRCPRGNRRIRSRAAVRTRAPGRTRETQPVPALPG